MHQRKPTPCTHPCTQAVSRTSGANHADGRVLVVAQGPRAACQKLLQLLQGDTTPGRVAKVVADWSQSTEQITGFSER